MTEHKIVCCSPVVVLQSHKAKLLHSLPLACTHNAYRKQKRKGKDTILLLKSHSFSSNLISSEYDFYYVYICKRLEWRASRQCNWICKKDNSKMKFNENAIRYIRILLKNKTLFLFQYIAQQHQNSFRLLPFRPLLHSPSSITYLLEMFLFSKFGGRMMSTRHY